MILIILYNGIIVENEARFRCDFVENKDLQKQFDTLRIQQNHKQKARE